MLRAKEFQPWQVAMESSVERLQYLYNSGLYSDLELHFSEDKEGEVLKVHRLVLSMCSPVFGAMLKEDMPEGNKLCLQDSPVAMKKVLDYMYLDTLRLDSVPMAMEVYALAHKYEMVNLKEHCTNYITATTGKTTIPLPKDSRQHEDHKLNKKSTKGKNSAVN